jgi:tRNA-(ms[2]io[6]A)-hydroxylase
VLGLQSRTDPEWARAALGDEIALLRDHAHLERKAAGHVITLLGRLPDAADRLLAVAREELAHFERVAALLARRGAGLGPDAGSDYVRRLAREGDGSLLDRLLRMGLIEARSYERFCLLAAAASGDLRELYADLEKSEAAHHALFVKLAHERFPRERVRARWDALAGAEAAIAASTPWGARVH